MRRDDLKASPGDHGDMARVLAAIAAGGSEPQAGPAIRARLDPPVHPLRLAKLIRLLSAQGAITLGPGSGYNTRSWLVTPKATEQRADGVAIERTPRGVKVAYGRASTLLVCAATEAEIERAAARMRELGGAP